MGSKQIDRKRVVAATLCIAAVVSIVVWRATEGDPTDPFPSVGVLAGDDDVDHLVLSVHVTPEGLAETTDRREWRGSMLVDPDGPTMDPAGSLDDFGRKAPLVTDAGVPVGWSIRGVAWEVALFDPDADGTVDLALFRTPGERPDGVGLTAFHELAFALGGADEVLVGRDTFGAQLAESAAFQGFTRTVCDNVAATGSATTPPPEAVVLWCQEPLADPEPVPGGRGTIFDTDADEGDIATGDRTGPSLLRSRPAARVPSQQVPDPFPGESIDAYCARLERNEKTVVEPVEDVAERAKEIGTALHEVWGQIQDVVERIEKVEQFLRGSEAERRAMLFEVLEGATNDQIGQTMSELWNQATEGTPEDIRELAEVMRDGALSGFGVEWYKSLQEWAGGVAEKVAAILDQQGDERCGSDLCRLFLSAETCAPDRPDPPDNPPGRSSRGSSDPHITTFDGRHYDFQGVGEYWFARGDQTEVQVRYGPLDDGSVSVAVAAGFRLPGADEAVSLYAEEQEHEAWVVYLGTQRFRLESGHATIGSYTVVAEPGDRISFDVDGRVRFDVYGRTGSNDWFNLTQVTVREDFVDDVVGGIGGSPDGDPGNDLTTADGVAAPEGGWEGRDLYERFGESWRITSVEESHFLYGPGEDPSTFHNPRFPSREATLESLSREQLVRGLRACLAAGISVEPSLSNCAFDVAVTDDERWVDASLQEQRTTGDVGVGLPLALPGGLMPERGSFVLWERDGVRVTGLVVGVSGPAGIEHHLRGLLVETSGRSELVWPGWSPVPSELHLGDELVLEVAAIGRWGLLVSVDVDDGDDGVGGLATERGTEPDPATAFEGDPSSGAPVLTGEQLDRWRSDWLVEAGR